MVVVPTTVIARGVFFAPRGDPQRFEWIPYFMDCHGRQKIKAPASQRRYYSSARFALGSAAAKCGRYNESIPLN